MSAREQFSNAKDMPELLAISEGLDLIGHNIVNRKDIGKIMAQEILCYVDEGGDMYPLSIALDKFQQSVSSNTDWFIVNDDNYGIEDIEFIPVDNSMFDKLKGSFIEYYDTVGWPDE